MKSSERERELPQAIETAEESANIKTPDSSRKGDWQQTYSGVMFWPLDPRPEEILLEDIAHALSLQCRFAGHIREFYSVAQHSVQAAWCLRSEAFGEPRLALLTALFHDASEAYLVDLPRPLKRYSELGQRYTEVEDRLMEVISKKFGFEWPLPDILKLIDTRLLLTEKRDLYKVAQRAIKPWEDHGLKPYDFPITPWPPQVAERIFLQEALRLGI
jgi:uncharacterized protein